MLNILYGQNHVDTDTEGAIESVRINGVFVLSGSCYQSQNTLFIRTKQERNERGHWHRQIKYHQLSQFRPFAD